MNNKLELMSPVGDQDSLYAAVQNGCDAIYLGGKLFNARNRAENFSLSELKSAIDYAHIRGVKVYITVNTLYKDQEIEEVLDFIAEIYQAGTDGVIVQDLGAARLIHKAFPDLELHASTQLTVHNLAGANYLETLGFSRVVLARELSLPEIKEIKQKTDLEVETFIHGALCICYSGQCLMSSLIGGRSGNRGRCAQPCRLPYSVVDLETEEVLKQELAQKHLLSPKDINTLELLPELIEAGITAFKIEGRVKRAEYTALATRVYRKYIDQYFEAKDDYEVKEQDQEKLAQLFNRGGFIPGYYQGKEGLDLISHERPNNWGVKIGEVVAYDSENRSCRIALTKELNQGDGIEIWTDQGPNPNLIVGTDIERIEDNIVEIVVRKKVTPGDAVYKTADKKLLEQLSNSFQQPNTLRQITVYGELTAHIGKQLEFKLWDEAGFSISASVDFIPEVAKNQPLTTKDIREQLSRLGNTPYQLENLDLETDENLFIPVSKLNQLRRNAVEKLNQKRKNQFVTDQDNKLSADLFTLEQASQPKEKGLTVYLQQADYITEVIELGVDRLYCASQSINLEELDDLVAQAKAYETELFVRLPRIAREEEMTAVKERINKLEETKIDGYLVPQLGIVNLLKKTDKKLVADFPLNNFNSYTTQLWQEEGYDSVVLSPELTLEEIKELASYNKIDKEIIVYGHLPMMISEHCPVGYVANDGAVGPCQEDCLANSYGLLDRKKMIAPIKTNPDTCRSIIYNSQPVYLLKHWTKLKESNCQNYRLDFTIEDKEEVLEIIKAYQTKLDNPQVNTDKINKLNHKMQQKGYTTGHFFRGVK
ncbi:DUF3656 domain-containing U32 family peptidase [Halanaerobaculum tunisiense]